MRHLASALLGYADPKITEEHHNRAFSLSAAKEYADILGRHFGGNIAVS
jgi:hypothetical protein